MLLQADAHEAQIMQVQRTTGSAHTIAEMMEEAEHSKQSSAEHHEHARHQVHLAEGFLSLAKKHHAAATDAALRCHAMHMLAKFGMIDGAAEEAATPTKGLAKAGVHAAAAIAKAKADVAKA